MIEILVLSSIIKLYWLIFAKFQFIEKHIS